MLRPSLLVLALLALSSLFGLSTVQAQDAPALGKIKKADTVAIDCSECVRTLAKAADIAEQELTAWNRFRLVDDPKQADLVFIFSANPYTGDYLTRKGADERPVKVDGTILTVIDPHTGEELWSDSKRWGSIRIAGETKALIDELRSQLEAETKRWGLDDVLDCNGAAAYQVFAFLTPDAALAKSAYGVRAADDAPNRLTVNSPSAPDFCRRAQLLVGANNRVSGYQVVAFQSDSLDVADVLEHADRFDFSSGKFPGTQKVYFIAQTKDRKVSIQFDVQGRRTVLSRVNYYY